VRISAHFYLEITLSKKKSNTGTGRQSDINVMDREDHEIKKPKKYKAVMLNDDYTPMDFVMVILMQIFRKSGPESFKLMMDVHEKGKGIAGVYPKGICVTKCNQAVKIAREAGFPFLVQPEEE
jgi:ATP-dependent Clp protease adaptor protein ClpS